MRFGEDRAEGSALQSKSVKDKGEPFIRPWVTVIFIDNNPCLPYNTVIILEGVAIIDTGAFSQCSNLKKVILPESTEQICCSAFAYCTSLTDIRIPAGVREIEEGYCDGGVFRGCGGLKSITVDPANEVYESPNNCNAIIKKKVRKLVAGCKNTVIPDGVKSIAVEAFGRNNELTSIAIPDSVTYIGAAASAGA